MDMETNLNIMHNGILERRVSRHSIPPNIPRFKALASRSAIMIWHPFLVDITIDRALELVHSPIYNLYVFDRDK